MALQRIADFEPNYKEEIFAGDDIKGFDVYAGDSDEKVGTVYDALVDETGRFRYLVVDTGIWIFGKKVLLPIGSARFDYGAHRVYATGLRSKAQAEQLPAYNELEPVDYDREEQVRGVYRNQGTAASTAAASKATPASYDRSNYSYDMDRPLYETNEQNHQNLKLYEERLVANKQRAKTGEVAVGKRVETETARASVPIEKERVVIERVTPVEAGRVVSVGEADFQSGEVARMEVYEETADIHKEAYVREEVNVRKEVVRSTVDGEETLRREELDIQTDGTPVVDNKTI
ncbi:MAG: DUF2382 domain-containing protein [Microcoleus sp. PH2017_10_PVI_O_A]|uniref:DUF2382 domain-containing protein n=1 Tax=unclassified Microcoleus TaxID=2642155 RepID=UPI001D9D02C9|nr:MULTISPECIES: DUF2382 domain-containing protein [unclassified Microcoleus]TAE82464.1 MAG: DUF2382 domain-containing protein [Oscillatoriales cyanobacterium]MCC3406181.1 DUF2382 domain-containing protein [Microcoleus sp. PH2017_10_PVI_O_A]MCC3460772.1 DUF2382 domain-containing protein [Microcoleus sp. PH2017_11_PCY_U_A]MCC3479335.1 DUF2382 domain-containing protein [Microcoleus sp. PH2017_12_PCY_D_A]MCC3529125.1 DUF2382 domain-containing protein [Microcoleus sp. PH2017_21_RUC_O_A]